MVAFATSRPLRFGDCDPAGIAYFPAYLDMLVGVVEEFFAGIGAPWPDLLAKQRIGVPTVKLDLTFVAPGFHGDRLDFALAVRQVGGSSLALDHAVSASGRLLWTARQTLVATSLDTHKAHRWPDDVRAALVRLTETSDAHDPAA